MGRDNLIAEFRKSYADKSDDELLHALARWVPHSEQHIAATQELHARRQATERLAAEESMRQERELHAKTQRIAKWGLGVGIAALIVGVLAFARDWFPEVFRPAATTSAAPLSTSAPVSVSATSAVVQRAISMSATSSPPQAQRPPAQ